MNAAPVALTSLAWVLIGYLALQVLLNVINALFVGRSKCRVVTLLKCAFWSTIANALYFLAAAVLLRTAGYIELRDPQGPLGLQALAGIPAGAALWFVSTLGRKLGRELFGRSELSLAEDAMLRTPPSPRYVSWGMLNLAVIQPLGRELFLRGTFLATVSRELGWGWGIAGTLIVELLLRLEIGLLFYTLAYAGFMCGLFWLTGNATCGLVAAMVAGLLHGAVLLRTGAMRREKGSGIRDQGRQVQG